MMFYRKQELETLCWSDVEQLTTDIELLVETTVNELVKRTVSLLLSRLPEAASPGRRTRQC